MGKRWSFQDQAVRKVVNALLLNSRAQLVMACGTGKTRIGLRVLEKLGTRKNLILVPSLALIEQTLREYQERGSGFDTLVVCSDPGVRPSSDITVTEDKEVVETFLRKHGPRIVFCTYQSCGLLESIAFDFAIYDEAHKTAGDQDKLFASTLDNASTPIKKRLFMTATPRKSKITKDGPHLAYSMDDSSVYGEVAYRLSFRKAIELGVICDYRIIITVVLENHLRIKGSPRPLAIAISKAMKKTGAKKAFTYHHTVAGAETFVDDNCALTTLRTA